MTSIPPSPPTTPANIQNYQNNNNWSSGYDTARSQFEQSRHTIGEKADDIYKIYQQAGGNPLTAAQSSQAQDDFKAMAEEGKNNQKLAAALTAQANTDGNSNELHDANTEIAGENATIQNATQQIHDLQSHNGLDNATGGSAGDLASQNLESNADQLTTLANQNAQGGAFTSNGQTFQTNTLTNAWHTDVNGSTPNSPGTTGKYTGSQIDPSKL